MAEIREPWASGFGYGGLAKKMYTRRLKVSDEHKILVRYDTKRAGQQYQNEGELESCPFSVMWNCRLSKEECRFGLTLAVVPEHCPLRVAAIRIARVEV